jgi:hypothetical protein
VAAAAVSVWQAGEPMDAPGSGDYVAGVPAHAKTANTTHGGN